MDDHSAIDDQVGLGAEEGRGPDDKVGELAGLDRADLMPHALRVCRVDRIFGDVAPRAQIVVVAALAGKRAALPLHLVRGLPGAGDHLADQAPRLAARRDDRERNDIVAYIDRTRVAERKRVSFSVEY